MTIRPVPLAQVQPLRQAVLYPHRAVEDCAFAGDEAAGAVHLGAVRDDQLVGVASLLDEAPPDTASLRNALRVRSVAVHADCRGQGVGAALMAACQRHAARAGARGVWCNVRLSAVGFYERLGFEQVTEPFEKPGFAVRFVVMQRRFPDEA